ncbi:hypothetical protein TNCV_4619221 [Trichonephila clavipes]|nr:hypothetical protein TNCV_4619221 [Trichonephila clavipes]
MVERNHGQCYLYIFVGLRYGDTKDSGVTESVRAPLQEGPNSQFVQARVLPNSPSQMIPDMLNWRQIWGSGRSRKGSKGAETVL